MEKFFRYEQYEKEMKKLEDKAEEFFQKYLDLLWLVRGDNGVMISKSAVDYMKELREDNRELRENNMELKRRINGNY